MQAGKDKVIAFHYTLSVDGAQVESSRDRGEPLWVLLGHGQLITGLERALEGREAGETFEVEIPPADAYGERREGLSQRVPKKYFQQPARLKPGMTTVDVDLNHPLAGKTLRFDVAIETVREASEEELQHGHAHPPGVAAH